MKHINSQISLMDEHTAQKYSIIASKFYKFIYGINMAYQTYLTQLNQGYETENIDYVSDPIVKGYKSLESEIENLINDLQKGSFEYFDQMSKPNMFKIERRMEDIFDELSKI